MKKLIGLAAAWGLRKPEYRARLKRKGKEMLSGFHGRQGSSSTQRGRQRQS